MKGDIERYDVVRVKSLNTLINYVINHPLGVAKFDKNSSGSVRILRIGTAPAFVSGMVPLCGIESSVRGVERRPRVRGGDCGNVVILYKETNYNFADWMLEVVKKKSDR